VTKRKITRIDNVSEQYNLRPRQKEFLKNKALGMGTYQAAINAGYTKYVSKNAKTNILSSPRLQTALEKLRNVIETDDRLIDEVIKNKLIEGMDADKYTQTGIKHADHKTRLDYIKYINSIKGINPEIKQVDVNHNVNPFSAKELIIEGEIISSEPIHTDNIQ
jgi:hypothetical protein